MVSVTVEIRKSAPAPSAREPSAGSGSGKPASARPRSYPCHASHHLHVMHRHKASPSEHVLGTSIAASTALVCFSIRAAAGRKPGWLGVAHYGQAISCRNIPKVSVWGCWCVPVAGCSRA